MDNETANALIQAVYDLRNHIIQQMEKQEESNKLLKSLIHTMQMTGQATADLSNSLNRNSK